MPVTGPRAHIVVAAVPVLLVLGTSGRAGAQRVGLLPVDGPRQLASALDPALKRAVADAGAELWLDAPAIKRRLAAAPGLAKALNDARRLVERAERARRSMQRDKAVSLARQALSILEWVDGRYHEPDLVARTQVALALGLLLEPVDQAAALEALRSAEEASPGYSAGAGLAPVAGLQERARSAWGTPRAPRQAALKRQASELALTHLVWLAVRPSDPSSKVRLQVVVAAAEGDVRYQRGANDVRRRDLLPAAARLVVEALRAVIGPAGRRPSVVAKPSPHRGREGKRIVIGATASPPRRGRQPFYRRWWFWTAVGIAAVSAAVGVGVATRAGGSDRLPGGEAGTITLE